MIPLMTKKVKGLPEYILTNNDNPRDSDFSLPRGYSYQEITMLINTYAQGD